MAATESSAAYARCVPYLESFLEVYPLGRCVPAVKQLAVAVLAAFYAVSAEMGQTTDEADALKKAVAGQQISGPYAWLFEAVADVVKRHGLSVEPWLAILEGRGQEKGGVRFQTYEQLVAHLALVAAPVGHILVALLGKRNTHAEKIAGKIACALFLTHRWLNYVMEARAGRVYLPIDDLLAFGGKAEDVSVVTSPILRKSLAVMAGRTRTLYAESRELSRELPFPLNWKARKVWLEGHFLLNKFGEQGYDPSKGRPRLTLRGKLRIFGLALLSR